MMLFHLIKKDIVIVKKYALLMLAVAVALPPFILSRLPRYASVLGFMLSVIYTVFMLLQYVSMKENQFPKAATLLCATPFSRRMMVLSRYLFCMAIYAACCVIYGIETLVFPGLGAFDMQLPVFMFLIVSVIIGVYLPMHYKLGYEKTKLVLMVFIIASPYLLPLILKMAGPNPDFLSLLSPVLVYGFAIPFGFIFLTVSFLLSVKLYDNADLA